MTIFIVYSVESTSVTIEGVFSTHEAAYRCCERISAAGNPAVWMLCRSVDKHTHPHRIDIAQEGAV